MIKYSYECLNNLVNSKPATEYIVMMFQKGATYEEVPIGFYGTFDSYGKASEWINTQCYCHGLSYKIQVLTHPDDVT